MGHIEVVLDLAAEAGAEGRGGAEAVGPARVFEFRHIGQCVRAGGVEFYPDHAVAFLHGIGAEVGEGEFFGVGLDEGGDVEAGAGGVEAPAVVGAHEGAVAVAAGGEAGALVGAGDVGGEEASVGEAGDDEFLVEQGVADDFTGREVGREGDGLPSAAEGAEGEVCSEFGRAGCGGGNRCHEVGR